jgi:tRNA threonylcarbamoyladenosine biosynthesis protein TsaB
MRVLAIDTALDACSVAVLDTQRAELTASETLEMTRGHAEALMPMVARVMDRAKIEFTEIDRVAVTVVPGSFTGLRVGIAAARGIALAAGKPAVGLTTLSGFAAPHIAEDDTKPVTAVIDARHEHVYVQVFAPGGRTIIAPRLAPLREAVRAAVSRSARITGSAAELLASVWPHDEPMPVVVDQRNAPDIGWVARLGAAAADGHGPPKPLYLRAPDAQPQDAARLPRR